MCCSKFIRQSGNEKSKYRSIRYPCLNGCVSIVGSVCRMEIMWKVGRP